MVYFATGTPASFLDLRSSSRASSSSSIQSSSLDRVCGWEGVMFGCSPAERFDNEDDVAVLPFDNERWIMVQYMYRFDRTLQSKKVSCTSLGSSVEAFESSFRSFEQKYQSHANEESWPSRRTYSIDEHSWSCCDMTLTKKHVSRAEDIRAG